MKLVTLLTPLLVSTFALAQFPKTDKSFEKILSKSEKLKTILSSKDEYEIQVIFTQINRDEQNHPSFKTYYFNHDPNRYFYPASTVKLPTALVAMERINKLKINGLAIESPMHIGSAFAGHEAEESDSTAQNGKPSVAHYAKKILLVSDNDAYNRLYDFLGQEYLNETLHQKGFSNMRLVHRLERAYSIEENKTTPEVWFEGPDGLRIFTQPAQKNTSKTYIPTTPIKKGIGYIKGDVLINEPFDFTAKNFYGLEVQHELLKTILFPEAVKSEQRFDLTEADYLFLYKYMSMLPKETTYPNYNTSEYWDSYVKFFMFGDSKEPMPTNIRIFNKVGDAYGYLLDNAYIVDFENKVEFMLSAVIHTNKDQIYNDGKYEYEEVGFPFMAEVGKVMYNFELKRKKKHLPDLSRYKW